MAALPTILALSVAALSLAAPAAAQDYPARPIRVIASSSAGGTSDIFMRALGEELHKTLGQPVIVENRPGGAFNIGARACAEAAPDGYTLCIIPGEPLVFNQFLFKTLAFDPAAFEPVTELSRRSRICWWSPRRSRLPRCRSSRRSQKPSLGR